MEILSSPRFDIKKGLIINTGVNDVEHLSIDAVTKKQVDMVELAMIAFPGKKIIIFIGGQMSWRSGSVCSL